MYDLAFNKYHCVLKLQAENILEIFLDVGIEMSFGKLKESESILGALK